jgi:hypothetical protein
VSWAQLDQAWERDKKRLLMRTKYGREFVPTRWSAALVGVLSLAAALGVGVWLTSLDPVANPGGRRAALLFVAIVVLVGGGVSLRFFFKAEAYERAHAAYLRKRDEDRARFENPPHWRGP